MVGRLTPISDEEKASRERKLELRYGGKQGLKAKRREWQAKSRLNYSGDGGLRSMTPERRKEISKLGGKARWHGKS